jgi:hypothetical protein
MPDKAKSKMMPIGQGRIGWASLLVALLSLNCSGADNRSTVATTSGGDYSVAGSSSGGTSAKEQSTGGKAVTSANGGSQNTAATTTVVTAATGGSASGGVQATGGARSTGGAAAGGTPPTGGTTATAGTANTFAAGGTPATGGTVSGGMPATGGSKAGTTAGGIPSAGGTNATGGAANGGTSATGGSKSTGGAGGNQSTGGTSATSSLLVPAQGALLGVFTPAQSQAELATTESQVGRKWAIHLGYFDWALDFASFAQSDIAAGRIPYVTVEPWNVTLDAIASGSEDSTIQSRAAGTKALNGKVLLRFAHEMNGNWYPWDGYHNGANTAAPAKYIAAYRHVKDVFVAAGVTNVLWVFCPNVDSVPSDAWNQWSNYYPGDTYVDWTCYDAYNWGTDTFAAMTTRIYSGLSAKNKPIMLGETSTQDVEKATWISAIIPAMKSQFPMLKALVWFDVNKENDWRYDSSSNSLGAFITMAKDPYFNP